MQSIGADKARLSGAMYWQQEDPLTSAVDMSQQLWQFKNRHTFRGSPVQRESQNILTENYRQLQEAMQLIGQTKVWTGYISPQQADKDSLQQYSQLKKKEGNQQVYIITEDKQFCPSLNKFLVLITYCQLKYALNPRYDFLKENYNGQ